LLLDLRERRRPPSEPEVFILLRLHPAGVAKNTPAVAHGAKHEAYAIAFELRDTGNRGAGSPSYCGAIGRHRRAELPAPRVASLYAMPEEECLDCVSCQPQRIEFMRVKVGRYSYLEQTLYERRVWRRHQSRSVPR